MSHPSYAPLYTLVALGRSAEAKGRDREGKENEMKRVEEAETEEERESEERHAEPLALSELASVREIPRGSLPTARHHKPWKA